MEKTIITFASIATLACTSNAQTYNTNFSPEWNGTDLSFTDGDVLALDAKFGFDDNALYRHSDIVAMRDTTEEDPREVEASKFFGCPLQ